MRTVFDIALHDLQIYLRSTGIIASMVILPVIMTVALGLGIGALNASPDKIRVDVIDSDSSALSGRFLDDLHEANAALVLCPFDDTEDHYCQLDEDTGLTQELAVARLADNTSLALIEIPAGFEAQLQAGEPVSIVYRSNESAAAPSYILQAVRAVVQRMGGALVAANVGELIVADEVEFADDAARAAFRQGIYERAAELWAENPARVDFQLTEVQAVSSSQIGFGQSVPGMATMFAMIFVFTGMQNLITERKNWTMQRLVTLPITRGQILGGKIVMYFSLAIIQFIIVYVLGIVLGVNYGGDLLALLVVIVSFSLCVTALTFAIGTMLRTEMQAAGLINLLGLTLAPLGGAWWPLDIVPDFMRVIGHLSPVAWAMDSFRILSFEHGGLADILGNVAVLLGAAVIFFAFAIWRFRYE